MTESPPTEQIRKQLHDEGLDQFAEFLNSPVVVNDLESKVAGRIVPYLGSRDKIQRICVLFRGLLYRQNNTDYECSDGSPENDAVTVVSEGLSPRKPLSLW